MMLDDSNEEKITQGSISNLWHEVREGGGLGPGRLFGQGFNLEKHWAPQHHCNIPVLIWAVVLPKPALFHALHGIGG